MGVLWLAFMFCCETHCLYVSREKFGGSAGIRTRDQRIKSPVLYQLSYRPNKDRDYDEYSIFCQIDPTSIDQEPMSCKHHFEWHPQGVPLHNDRHEACRYMIHG